MSQGLAGLDALERYRIASERAADQVIRAYSTSFGAATRLLGQRHRQHVRNIYALVRVADELVDGVAAEAGLPASEQHQRLDAMEAETERAMRTGYSSEPIIHAFACTARAAGIDTSLTAPFFASMRSDIPEDSAPAPAAAGIPPAPQQFDAAAHAEYVFGSAEVVGLMCLRVFVRDEPVSATELAALERSARSLGAAFQNVNFLRDLADDTGRLSRNYLSDDPAITEEVKAHWVATIREQLTEAEAALPLLPRDARVAVDCARRLFARLNDRIARTPAADLLERRVRVSDWAKAGLIIQSISTTRTRRVA